MKINPNSFFKFDGKWSNKNGTEFLVSFTIPYKDVKRLETVEDEYGEVHYNLFVNFDEKVHMYSLAKEDYERIGLQLEQIDFGVPIIETQEQIRSVVKEEINKTKAKTAILSLEV
jgi:hypothetical protein